jgi:hypothetical protein
MCEKTKRYLSGVRKIKSYLFAKYGVRVVTIRGLGNSYYDPKTKSICMASKIKPKKYLCVLLHEAGHMLLELALRRRKLYSRVFDHGYGNLNVCTGSPNHKIDVLREETMAWEKAWELGNKLGVRISRKDFNVELRIAIRTYMQWGAGFWGVVK